MDDKAAYLRAKARVEAFKEARKVLLDKVSDNHSRREIVEVLDRLEVAEQGMAQHYAIEIANKATGS